jgi:two-component system, LuxR family, sensor kinase FixL
MSDPGPGGPGDERRFLAAMVDSSDDAIVGKDLDGVILTWNHGAERLYGYTAEELRGRSIRVLFPDDRLDELDGILETIRTGRRVERLETVRRTKSGTLVDVSVTVSPVRAADGTIVGGATIARDITARRQVEHALRTSEQRWRSIIESAVDGIVVIDSRGHIEAFNPWAERLFGYAEAEVVGRNVNMLMPLPYREEHDGYLSHYLTTGIPRIIGSGREVTGRRRDGTTFPVHLSVGEMVVDGERKFTGILHDLSARVRMEEQLREQAAMARLGEMAAVLAHEIKNPLAGIRGAVQVIGSRLPPESRDTEIATEIVKRIDGLTRLMKDVLIFARPPQPKPAAVDVGALLTLTAGLLVADPDVAGIRVEIDGAAPPIMADAELLKIAFANLLVNGAHAMEGEGVIHVSIEPVAPWCRIAFRDTGHGIPTENLEKIFTPFFTTKSKGTGLGLSTVKRLVDAHNGQIEIESPAGGGTVVILHLPTGPTAQP